MPTCTPPPEVDATWVATLLVIDDDPDMQATLSKGLGASGYRVLAAGNGAEARALVAVIQPDLIIMDLMLPDVDGLLLTPAFRDLTTAPILICSARQNQVDRVLGLKLGAGDFVAKPFDLDELEARIEGQLRRAASHRFQPTPPSGEICVGDLVIAPSRASVKIAGQPSHLTPTEYRLLVTLASEPHTLFTRESLIQRVWGYTADEGSGHLVDVHMGRLRSKLRAVGDNSTMVVNVRGRGYRLQEAASSSADR